MLVPSERRLGRYKPLGGGTSNTARVFFFVSFDSKKRNTRIVDSYVLCSRCETGRHSNQMVQCLDTGIESTRTD